MPQFVRAFRHRNYRLFFFGQLISLTGTRMQSVAESWLVFRLTGSSALLGVAAFASQVAVLLLAPLGGIAVNAFDIPARQAFVMDMVGRVDFLHAIALNSPMVNGAHVVGPSTRHALILPCDSVSFLN